MLRRDCHQVTLPADVGLAGVTDPRHLAFCAAQGLVLITKDHDDFLDLHDLVQATHGRHAGITVVCADNDPAKDIRDQDIVRALGRLESAGVAIENGFFILKHWRRAAAATRSDCLASEAYVAFGESESRSDNNLLRPKLIAQANPITHRSVSFFTTT